MSNIDDDNEDEEFPPKVILSQCDDCGEDVPINEIQLFTVVKGHCNGDPNSWVEPSIWELCRECFKKRK